MIRNMIETGMRIGTTIAVGMSLLKGGEPIKSPDLLGTDTEPNRGQACSFDPDCKDPVAPFCNINYDLVNGNHGTCSATDIPEPIQIIEGENCPPGTVKQYVYPNEGTEAVCIENE